MSYIRRQTSPERKIYNDGAESKESKSFTKILSKSSVQQEAEKLMLIFDKNHSKDLDREEFRNVLKQLDENNRDPLPSNFEYTIKPKMF